MRFLLINTNPAVSKLVNASLERIGHEATEIGDYNGLSLDTYVLVIVDSDSYRPEYKDDLLSVSLAPSLMYLKAQDDIVPQGVTYVLKKPFLPTDFIALLVSILYKTPELKRFITPEAEQFQASLLDYPQSEMVAAASIQPAVVETTNKPPVFDIQESQEPAASKKFDIFTNLSEELSKLYNHDGNEKDEPPLSALATEIDDVQPKTPIELQNDVKPAYDTGSLSLDEFMFGLKNAEDEVQPPQSQESSQPTNANEVDAKIDFNFSVFDNIGEETPKQEQESAKDEPKAPVEIEDEKTQEEPSEKANFTFGDLAKEFDDLLQTNKNDESKECVEPTCKNDDENIIEEEIFIKKDDTPQAPSEEIQEFDERISDLSERDMETALQSGGMLPQPSELEIVKTEIENVVAQSIQGVLQSQILREVFKGLKMNITITFEDK